MVGFIVAPLAVWQLMSPGYWRDLLGGSLILVFLFSFPVSYWRMATWPCPRCDKIFRRFSSDKCRRCALRIYAEDDPGAWGSRQRSESRISYHPSSRDPGCLGLRFGLSLPGGLGRLFAVYSGRRDFSCCCVLAVAQKSK